MEKDYNLLNTTPVSPILKQTTNSKNSSRSCTRGSFGMFFFWQVFVVHLPICTFYLKYWDKGLIAFVYNNELQGYVIAV